MAVRVVRFTPPPFNGGLRAVNDAPGMRVRHVHYGGACETGIRPHHPPRSRSSPVHRAGCGGHGRPPRAPGRGARPGLSRPPRSMLRVEKVATGKSGVLEELAAPEAERRGVEKSRTRGYESGRGFLMRRRRLPRIEPGKRLVSRRGNGGSGGTQRAMSSPLPPFPLREIDLFRIAIHRSDRFCAAARPPQRALRFVHPVTSAVGLTRQRPERPPSALHSTTRDPRAPGGPASTCTSPGSSRSRRAAAVFRQTRRASASLSGLGGDTAGGRSTVKSPRHPFDTHTAVRV